MHLALILIASLTVAQESATVLEGKIIYKKACAACHGVQGNGKGIGAFGLNPKPRDFTLGEYKIRSTANGVVPRDEDLIRTISEGMPSSAMPAWKHHLTRAEIHAVVQYIKTFSENFNTPIEKDQIMVDDMAKLVVPPSTSEAIAEGRKIYEEMGCKACHGETGRLDKATSKNLMNSKEEPIQAARLDHPENFKGGSTPQAIYRVLVTGLDGTPMPSFQSVLNDKQRWNLVHYILSLSDTSGIRSYFLRVPNWNDPDSPFN